ncbi:MAG TPA: nitrous oxide reductase accessory protein NosL, partial [Chitinophagaceae bacterium]|nr:nitrous oxide reductase accessory protein NosL [Chitinophagaceae bacterium]
AGAVFFLIYFAEVYNHRQRQSGSPTLKRMPRSVNGGIAAGILLLAFSSCSVAPDPIRYGKDACDFCRMTIITPGFGGEVLTKKGKVYKFDDLHCLVTFLKKETVKTGDIAQTLVVPHSGATGFLPAAEARFVVSPSLRSPMGSNTAAVADDAAAAALKTSDTDRIIAWKNLYSELQP